MKIFPAIDLSNGKCVRLLKGEKGTETVFSENPVEQAQKWEACGAGHLHVVDLDGAFNGKPGNLQIIKEIVNSTRSKVQVGGGIRDIESVADYLNSGVSRIILGTSAFKDPDLLAEACNKYPGRIAVGIDTKEGKIAIRGWTETINTETKDILDRFYDIGVSMIIHTDIDRDGTLTGINTEAIDKFVKKSKIPVIASGGISTIDDLDKLAGIESDFLYGAILGKSIYTGSIDLGTAVKRFENNVI